MKFSKKKKANKADEENIDENTSKESNEKKGVVESFLEGIPAFGNFFKRLGKSEVFQQKFMEANEKIEENLRRGDTRYVSAEGNISVRPLSIRPSGRALLGALEKQAPKSELKVEKDYAYGKKENKLILAVKAPKESVDANLTGRHVIIKGGNFSKKIELPEHYRKIEKKRYKKGILMLELEK